MARPIKTRKEKVLEMIVAIPAVILEEVFEEGYFFMKHFYKKTKKKLLKFIR